MSYLEFEIDNQQFIRELCQVQGLIDCASLYPEELFDVLPWKVGSISECIWNLLETYPCLQREEDGSFILPSQECAYVAIKIEGEKAIGVLRIFSPLEGYLAGIYVSSIGQHGGFICIEEEEHNEDDFIKWSLCFGKNN